MAKKDGSGGYWRGNKWIAITWTDKISKSLAALPLVDATCQKCGKTFQVRTNLEKVTKWCSRECRYDVGYRHKTGIDKKVTVLGANLIMGKGKKEALTAMVNAALGSPCRYCGEPLTLDNLTIDHKTPYGSSELRRNKAVNKAHRQHMDRAENLEVICQPCNQLKGRLDDRQFRSLLDFLAADEAMRADIFTRLRRSMAPFGKRR